MQNLECVTPSWTQRTNNSGVGASPQNPPTSAPVFCMSDMAELSWMCWDPRMLCQLVRLSPDQVEQAYLNDAGFPERVRTNVRRSGEEACSVSWLKICPSTTILEAWDFGPSTTGTYLTLFIISLPVILPIRPVLTLPSHITSRLWSNSFLKSSSSSRVKYSELSLQRLCQQRMSSCPVLNSTTEVLTPTCRQHRRQSNSGHLRPTTFLLRVH